MSENLYQEELIDHYKHPRNKKNVDEADFSSGHNNPACGDAIEMSGKIVDGTITELGFGGSGCIVSMATASMLTEKVLGKTVEDVMKLNKDDILEMIGLKLGPNRLKCALMSLETLQDALKKMAKK